MIISPMMVYLTILLIGIVFGYYMGNKRFRRIINHMIRSVLHKDEDDELYPEEDED